MSGDPIVKVKVLDLFWKNIALHGFSLGHSKYDLKIPLVLEESARLIASGGLRVPATAVYPLGQRGHRACRARWESPAKPA